MMAVFLDRDGVICEHRPDYVKSWDEFQFLPGSLEALNELSVFEGPIIVVSNQSCVGRGLVPEDIVRDINSRMVDHIKRSGGRIDDVYFCPHRPEEGCSCRKPATGMLENAAVRYSLDLKNSWMVGDNITDIQMGKSAGCHTILVRTGLGETFVKDIYTDGADDPFVYTDLQEAVKAIINIPPKRNLER
jgi:D-glycero-D-manno-heptose 1,7-bisphosphate phosphatase